MKASRGESEWRSDSITTPNYTVEIIVRMNGFHCFHALAREIKFNLHGSWNLQILPKLRWMFDEVLSCKGSQEKRFAEVKGRDWVEMYL